MSGEGQRKPQSTAPHTHGGGDASLRHLSVPMNSRQWLEEADHYPGLRDASLHQNRQYDSASKMQNEQYLLLRTLWSSSPPNELSVDHEVGDYYEKAAEAMLASNNDWKRYVAELGKGSGLTYPYPQVGLFTSALLNMRGIKVPPQSAKAGPGAGIEAEEGAVKVTAQPNVLHMITDPDQRHRAERDGLTPRKRRPPPRPNRAKDEEVTHALGPATPVKQTIGLFARMKIKDTDEDYREAPKAAEEAAASDEMLVNLALVLWLQAVLNICPGNKIHASIERGTFLSGNNWKALTDGLLCDLGASEKVCCILEAKRYRRLNTHVAVRRQEAGEMVCWIATDKSDEGCYLIDEKVIQVPGARLPKRIRTHKRLLIAQDQREIWFVVATYGEPYARYVRGDIEPEPTAFMHMKEYGPFNVWNPTHMHIAGKFLLAVILRFNQRRMRHEEGLHARGRAGLRSSRSEPERARLPSRSRSRAPTPGPHRDPRSRYHSGRVPVVT